MARTLMMILRETGRSMLHSDQAYRGVRLVARSVRDSCVETAWSGKPACCSAASRRFSSGEAIADTAHRQEEARHLLEDAGYDDVQLYHRHGYSWTVVGKK